VLFKDNFKYNFNKRNRQRPSTKVFISKRKKQQFGLQQAKKTFLANSEKMLYRFLLSTQKIANNFKHFKFSFIRLLKHICGKFFENKKTK
jgi:hypothetical protein